MRTGRPAVLKYVLPSSIMTKLPHQHDLIAVIETNERIQRKVGERGGAPLDFGFDFAVGDGKSSPGVDRRFFAVRQRTGIRAAVGIGDGVANDGEVVLFHSVLTCNFVAR